MFGYSLQEERAFHESVAIGILLCSIPTFIALQFLVDSPWGKLSPVKTDRSKWWLGPLLPARASWFVFEIQNVLWAVLCWSQRNEQVFQPANAVLLSLFVLHYINRAIVYPLRMKKSHPVPVLVVACAFTFCTCNG